MNQENQPQQAGKKWQDIDATTSERTGVAGLLETGLRRFRLAGYIIALIPLYVIGILAMGISAMPAVYLFRTVLHYSTQFPPIWEYLAISTGLVAAYFSYGITLIFVIPLFNFLMPFRLKPFRAPYYSLTAVPWYFHNAFTYIVRYTFLEFITPTPLNMLFYRMMGMKIGRGAHINTTNISDPCLIEIGDKVTIGGSVHIIAHYASRGFLIAERVKLDQGVTVGLKATIMGDVEIGANSVIAPHEVILPKSRIPVNRKPALAAESTEASKVGEVPSQDFL